MTSSGLFQHLVRRGRFDPVRRYLFMDQTQHRIRMPVRIVEQGRTYSRELDIIRFGRHRRILTTVARSYLQHVSSAGARTLRR